MASDWRRRHLRQRGVELRANLWPEEELWPQEALVADLAAELLTRLGVHAHVGLDILIRLLVMLGKLLDDV